MSSVWAVDPSRRISQYGHTSWRIQDGAFSGEPQAIAQTADGYLWIATLAGLVRFDGVRFVSWTPLDGKRLPSSKILSAMGGSDGSLWIGTAAGLARWQNGNLVNYPETGRYVNAIIERRNGTVWIARSRGDPTTYSPVGLKSNEEINGIMALAVTPEGTVWVGTVRHGRGAGLQQLVQGKWKPFVTSELDSSTLSVNALLVDRENTLWIGTRNEGIYRIRGQDVDHFRGANGLSSDSVNGFYEDREGNLWVATAKGIDVFRDLRVVNFSTSEGLSADVVNSVLASRDGTIWIGNPGALDSLRKGNITSIRQNHGLPGSQVTSLFEDRAGRFWVGIDDKLYIYKDGKFIPINTPDGKPVGAVTAITEDADDNIWAEVVDPNGLVRIHNREVREELAETQVPRGLTLAGDPGGGIWLGLLSGGLARYRDGHLETFPFERRPDSVPIRQIAVSSDGSVLGATSEGVIGLRNRKLQSLDIRNGLPCNDIYTLIWDDRGALWLNSQCGVVAIASEELRKWWAASETVVRVRLFDLLDGAQPSNPPFRPAASRSPDGRLWFANENVLQMIDPAHVVRNPVAPPVHVENVVADRKSYPPRRVFVCRRGSVIYRLTTPL